MTLNPATPLTQVSFLEGCQVFDVAEPSRPGKIVGAGAEQCEVQFDDGVRRTGDQTRLFRCMENLEAIERWLAQRSEIEQSRLNHPSTIWRRWQASLKPPVSDDERKSSPVQKLKDTIVDLQEQNDRMRHEIERGGGDLWCPEDRPKDIAKIICAKLTKAKAEKVAREILAALKEQVR
jgi:hypothetical protein